MIGNSTYIYLPNADDAESQMYLNELVSSLAIEFWKRKYRRIIQRDRMLTALYENYAYT